MSSRPTLALGALLIPACSTVVQVPQHSGEPVDPPRIVALEDLDDPDGARRAARAAITRLTPSLSLHEDVVSLVAEELRQPGLARLAARRWRTARAVAADLDRTDLPEIVLGIPFAESRLRHDVVSPSCAAGPWQLMPETATSLGLGMAECSIEGADLPWSPDPRATYASRFSPYRGEGRCLITGCALDQRFDLRRSTAAATRMLSQVRRELADHPQSTPLAVLAYNAGPGKVRYWVETNADPIGYVTGCGQGCSVPREQVRYLPRVIAGAALTGCNAVGDLWSRTELCATMHGAGLAPAPPTASEALEPATPVRLARTPGDPVVAARIDDALGALVTTSQDGPSLQPAVDSVGGVRYLRLTLGDGPQSRTAVASLADGSSAAARVAASDLFGGSTGDAARNLVLDVLGQADTDDCTPGEHAVQVTEDPSHCLGSSLAAMAAVDELDGVRVAIWVGPR